MSTCRAHERRSAAWLWPLAVIGLLALAALACNLSRAAPTSTPRPPATEITVPTNPVPVQPSVTAITDTFSLVGSTPTFGTPGVVGDCPVPTGWIVYIVEPGDSLSLLASQTSSTITEIQQGNCLSNADTLFVGQTIYLPRTPVIGL